MVINVAVGLVLFGCCEGERGWTDGWWRWILTKLMNGNGRLMDLSKSTTKISVDKTKSIEVIFSLKNFDEA